MPLRRLLACLTVGSTWTLLGPGGVAPALAQDAPRVSRPASEANPAEPAAGHSPHGESFDEGPRRRASLLPGMGRVAFPVAGTTLEAQAFLDQGVAQLHSFYDFEAERSFRQAAALDPGCPMAYWGMAMANSGNPKRARGFLKEARARAEARPPGRRERLYLDALGALLKDGSGEAESRKAYFLALEALAQEFPADMDARAWMALTAWQNAAKDGIGSRQALDLALDSVLARAPGHPGAYHYQIHLWDHAKPERALAAAALYATSAPGIAHAWHMPGHTYTELRRYADAAYQQEGSARVDHAAMLRDRIMPWEIHNYAHNNQWLATSLAHVGRAREAVAVARNLVEQPRDPVKNAPTDGGSAARSGRLRWAEVLAKFELWDDLIAATQAGDLDWSDQPAERVERAYALGLAHAAKGDRPNLDVQVEALRALTRPRPGSDKDKDKDKDPAAGLAAAPLAELEARQALLRGDIAAACELLGKATQIRPEALARAQLAARNFGLAEAAARAAVAKQPGQVAPLAAEVEVLAACGKVDEAKAAYRLLRPLAARADADLPALARLRPVVAAWDDPEWARPAEPTPIVGRVALEPLGPLGWTPFAAESFTAVDTEGAAWSLADHRGRNVVVLFYLGGKCPHCMQQLQEFGKQAAAFRELGVDVVAVGTDDRERTRELKHNNQGVAFPMPLLADPDFALFKAYGAFDDFENIPLHGTFLVDRRGDVRYQKIGAEPFLDVEFLKGEARRVDHLVRPDRPAQAARVGTRAEGD